MTKREEILIKNYTTLVMANVKIMEEVPENLREAVEIEKAQREIAILTVEEDIVETIAEEPIIEDQEIPVDEIVPTEPIVEPVE